jgi:DNA polymerase-3 subunit epsilon
MSQMNFTVIDVETANADRASICQVGTAHFVGGRLREMWGTLVNPESGFDQQNVAVHGIDESAVRQAPTFRQIADEVWSRLANTIVVSHALFDRMALQQACDRHAIPFPDPPWLDATRVVRRAWPELSRRGYGLANITAKLGISFNHHDATEDARAAGEVLIKACEIAQCTVADWMHRATKPMAADMPIARKGNPEGPLCGEVIVFTGAMTMSRRQAASLAAEAGCIVATSVNRRTTALVVGNQDAQQFSGELKSAKHCRAEELIERGHPIRILGESAFLALIGLRRPSRRSRR